MTETMQAFFKDQEGFKNPTHGQRQTSRRHPNGTRARRGVQSAPNRRTRRERREGGPRKNISEARLPPSDPYLDRHGVSKNARRWRNRIEEMLGQDAVLFPMQLRPNSKSDYPCRNLPTKVA